MHWIALGARVLLALVFVTASIAKAIDREGSRRALVDFRVPARAVPVVAWLLPLAELAVAVAVMVQPLARAGAIGAFVLLGLFSGGIAAAMARGQAPDCHCFGQLSSAPAGRSTLGRNLVLLVPAGLVAIYGPGESLAAALSGRSPAVLTALVTGISALALLATATFLGRENRRLRSALSRSTEALAAFPPGLPVGAPAPSFALPSVGGPILTLDDLLDRRLPVAAVFVSPGCYPCVALMPDLGRWQATLSDRITIALIAAGSAEDMRQLAAENRLTNVLLQDEAEVFEAYRATASPSVVIIGPDGTIASRTNSTAAMVEAVIRNALHSDFPPPEPAHESLGAEALDVRQWSGAPSPA